MAQSAVPAEPLRDQLYPAYPEFGCPVPGWAHVLTRGASVCIPIRGPVWWRTAGLPVRGHDVSGTGWQTMRMGMQSITIMMPV